MVTNDPVLHVAKPHPCNTQQTTINSATQRATTTQQPSLKALALLEIGRTTSRNTPATAPEKHATNAQQTAEKKTPFVAQFCEQKPSNSKASGPPESPLLRVAQVRECNTQQTLERFAIANGINWPAARSRMVEGDAEAGAEQLAADTDGAEHASVLCWLRLLADGATSPDEPAKGHERHGTGLDAYGRPLPPARALVTCGACQCKRVMLRFT